MDVGKQVISGGASAEQLKNRDDNKSVDETAETENSIVEKESDVGKQVMSGDHKIVLVKKSYHFWWCIR